MRIVLFLFLLAMNSCSPVKQIRVLPAKPGLRFIGHFNLPTGFSFNQTEVGGLSGIDYDPDEDLFYLVSDDPSKINPARFYTAKIIMDDDGLDTVLFNRSVSLMHPGGKMYSRSQPANFPVPDPEALRIHPGTGEVFWCSEGDRVITDTGNKISDPLVYIMDKEGRFRDSFLLPSNMRVSTAQKGPMNNGSFEGMSFGRNFKTLFVAMEEPLLEDGPKAGPGDSSAWIRIIQFDVKSRKPLAQFGYRVEPVAKTPVPAGAFKINGVSEILYIGNNRLLVMERSHSTGTRSNTIRLYIADLKKAADISGREGLHRLNFHPVSKKLLFNMDSLGMYIDNIEGVCFGPRLPNGKQSLVFVSDNNFDEKQVTQLLLFEVD